MSNIVQKSRRSGRPPGFDRQHVVAAARDVFWRKGLDTASYDDLTISTGLHRPSIHAAFGDKRGLFHAALDRYLKDAAAMLGQALSQQTLRDALRQFFATDLDLFLSPQGGRGCFALGVATEAGRADPDIAAIESRAWRDLTAAVAARINHAQDAEIPEGLSRQAVADLVTASHAALAVRSRAGDSREALEARVERCLTLFDRR